MTVGDTHEIQNCTSDARYAIFGHKDSFDRVSHAHALPALADIIRARGHPPLNLLSPVFWGANQIPT